MRHLKFFIIISVTILVAANCFAAKPHYANRAEKIVAEIHNPNSKYVVVACHRGDWRNYPENSIPAIESIIRMGADIMELDLKMTSDGVLVLCHDKTVDRTTSGKGLVSSFTFDSLRTLKLKRAHGVVTDSLRMPTLREALIACKDRIVVNVDQGYEFYDQVLAITEELGVTDQILIKGKKGVDVVAAKMSEHPHNMMYMPIIDILKPQGKALFEEYMSKKVVPLAYEVCWNKMSPEVIDCAKKVLESGSKLWVNTLWSSLNGGLDDDAALDCGNPAKIYDQVLDMGTSMIQTDRPEMLLNYLRKKGRHD
ncbi:MAG: glycerophosphodiester phosphodiesterase family protein [Bacteroidales bacterium]